MNSLYSKIKNRREELGYTQKYIADSLEIDAATYSRIENNKLDITVSRLEKIASLLKTNASSLLASDAMIPVIQEIRNPRVTLQIDLEDDIKEDVIKLAFGDRVMIIKNELK